MWLFSRYGFFSVVEKEKGKLTVRARVKRDLENLKNKYKMELGECEILENVGTDYEYRIICDKKLFSGIAANMMVDIDYENFKDMIDLEQGRARELIYLDIWNTLTRLPRA